MGDRHWWRYHSKGAVMSQPPRLTASEYREIMERLKREGVIVPDREPEGMDAPEIFPPNAPESLIEAECTKLLEEDEWWALRTDPVSDRSKGKGFGTPGMADHLFMRTLTWSDDPRLSSHQVLWVEFKCGKKKAGSHQLVWHRYMRALGFVTWIANQDFPATVEGFRTHYEKSGLMRRARWW
jgi:hypothetical protein